MTGTDASLSTSLSEIRAVALTERIEAESTARIGAAPDERVALRLAQGTCHRLCRPRRGMELGILEPRTGDFSTELPEPRRRIDKAELVVMKSRR